MIKRDCSSKNKKSSPSCCSKTAWFPFFYGTQKKTFLEIYIYTMVVHKMKINGLQTYSFMFHRIKSYRFGMREREN